MNSLIPLIVALIFLLTFGILAIVSTIRDTRKKKSGIKSLAPVWYEEERTSTCPWIDGRNFLLVEEIRCGWVKHICLKETCFFTYYSKDSYFSEYNIRCDAVSAQIAQARYEQLADNKRKFA